MSHFKTPELKNKFTDDVLSILSTCRAHKATGNQDGEESLSALVSRLRERGWKNISTSGWAGNIRDLCQEAGFSIREHRAGHAVRTYIGV